MENWPCNKTSSINSCITFQDTLIWNLTVYFHVLKRAPLDSVLSQLYPDIFTPHFSNTNFNIIIPTNPRSVTWDLRSSIQSKTPAPYENQINHIQLSKEYKLSMYSLLIILPFCLWKPYYFSVLFSNSLRAKLHHVLTRSHKQSKLIFFRLSVEDSVTNKARA
jgi:hypothetical protein